MEISLSNVKLRPYQESVLNELFYEDGIGLFLGTGSGKTITALARFIQNKTPNLLIVCPQKVMSQWVEVIKSVLPDLRIMEFKKSFTSIQINRYIKENSNKYDIIVINYEKLDKLDFLVKIINSKWTIILDESQKVKSYGTDRAPVKVTHAVLALGKLTKHKIILSATPTQKDKGGYIDLYTQLYFLGKIDYSLGTFKSKFCIEEKMQIPGMPYPIKIITGYKHLDELHKILESCCRYYAPKFNEFEPQHIQINLEKCSSYAKFVQDRVYKEIQITNVSANRIAKKTLAGGTITGHNAFGESFQYKDNDIKISWLSEFIENTDEKLIIFYKYNVELAQLEEMCKKLGKKYIVVNGSVQDKYDLVNNTDYEILLGQITACGEGIDGLQHKSHICLYYSLPESSIEYRQSLGRINRDGQKNVPIYYYLTMNGTVDTHIYKMLQDKIEFSEAVLDRLLIELE